MRRYPPVSGADGVNPPYRTDKLRPGGDCPMQDDRPSATAYRVALRRAAHQILDDPKVFDDPLAVAIVGGEGETRRRSGEARSGGRIARSMRAYMAMRSRYAEDRLAEAVARGARQYVVLGAG